MEVVKSQPDKESHLEDKDIDGRKEENWFWINRSRIYDEIKNFKDSDIRVMFGQMDLKGIYFEKFDWIQLAQDNY